MYSKIQAIEYHLPGNVVSNEYLESIYDDWTGAKIEEKTGIRERRIVSEDETALDIGFRASQKLISKSAIDPTQIDFILFCTSSPDYPLPPNACILQDRLSLPKNCGALDYNLACSGYVYGLGIASGLISSGQAHNILLVTSETYSKYIHSEDRSVRTIFGDGAAASLITASERMQVGPFIYGTDGSGFTNLMVASGGKRDQQHSVYRELAKKTQYPDNLYMNGPEIFSFTIKAVPMAINELLEKSNLSLDDIDYFIFHQANKFMLEHLRQKIGISNEKFFLNILLTGNTVSASIPIALKESIAQGKIQSGAKVLLIGFGVGYSWSATIVIF